MFRVGITYLRKLGAVLLASVLAIGVTATPVRAQASRSASAQKRPPAPPARTSFFTTPLTLADMQQKQAVVETSAGTFVIQLLPEAAPNHVGYFIKLAREGTLKRRHSTGSSSWGSFRVEIPCRRTRPGRRRTARADWAC